MRYNNTVSISLSMEQSPLIRWIRRPTQIHETIYVALPRDWVKMSGLTRFENIQLELMQDRSLRVTVPKETVHD